MKESKETNEGSQQPKAKSRYDENEYLHGTKVVPVMCDGHLTLYDRAGDALSKGPETRRRHVAALGAP